jgi:Uma2 family endonuclease
MQERMTAIQERVMSVEEYIQYELKSELRHEYINGQLIELPGEKDINNTIAMILTAFFYFKLREKGFYTYSHDIKVAIPNTQRIYYPDWFVTAELEESSNAYIKQNPELIVKILSKTSRTHDTVDKYLDYIKIPSLKYYLIIDPETPYVVVHAKTESGEWEADAYSSKGVFIPLPLLGIELPMGVIYK